MGMRNLAFEYECPFAGNLTGWLHVGAMHLRGLPLAAPGRRLDATASGAPKGKHLFFLNVLVGFLELHLHHAQRVGDRYRVLTVYATR